jgi:2-(1,2-epoxy-1,2-dihydrophenyl)acetyl-CoA isomerase
MTALDNDNGEILQGDGAVLLTLHGHVGHMELNRPESANGLDNDTLRDFRTALVMVQGDPRIRAVLLTGKGRNFCAGGNVRTFKDQGDKLPYYIRQATSALQEVISLMIHLDAPVLTAVQGFAAGGGGLGLICASDLVIASDSAAFLAGATRVAMAPDAGLSVTLPRLVGARKAAQMLLMNTTVEAAEALDIGLVNRIVPAEQLLDRAFEDARELAAAAPQALAATKRLLWSGVGIGVDGAMPEESRTVASLCRTEDVQEGLAAVIEKRTPEFTGR